MKSYENREELPKPQGSKKFRGGGGGVLGVGVGLPWGGGGTLSAADELFRRALVAEWVGQPLANKSRP